MCVCVCVFGCFLLSFATTMTCFFCSKVCAPCSLCHIHTHALFHSLQGSSFKEKQSHHPKKSSGSVGSFQQIRPRVFQLLLCFNLTLSLRLSLSPSFSLSQFLCYPSLYLTHPHTHIYTHTITQSPVSYISLFSSIEIV